jgi:mono/diheme cytochrome c family protein
MRGWPLVAAGFGTCLLGIGVHAATNTELPAGPGRDLVYAHCQTCHDPQYLTDSAGIPRDDWDAAIDNMRQYGLRISPDQRAKILDYLATYLGPNPPPAAKTSVQPAVADVDGAAVYKDSCTACHQENGQGLAGQFPPLAGNPDLFLDRDYPVKVILFGIEGKIEVKGTTYQSIMPPFAHLNDQQIAAVVGYIRAAWNNAKLDTGRTPKVDGTAVATVRAKQMTPAAVFADRKDLQKAMR